jgi:hypothetical protein
MALSKLGRLISAATIMEFIYGHVPSFPVEGLSVGVRGITDP